MNWIELAWFAGLMCHHALACKVKLFDNENMCIVIIKKRKKYILVDNKVLKLIFTVQNINVI